MAKILVADDNSNVQRTVTQALANLGVEVVAVNNGEAAVRKLSEISPDLVLADIFMPVRNGYEVCEFVKKDPRFAHVPVVLLAGAFDPFDEREAQRVGADGILKKPFVPPDPLVTMVKTLLDRVMGERLMAVSVSNTAESRGAQAAAATEVLVHPGPPEPEPFPEPSLQEGPSPSSRVSFGEGERPVAFGALLETSEPEVSESHTGTLDPVDDEQILTSQRDTKLGEPIFWRNDNENEKDADVPAAELAASTEHSLEVSTEPQELTVAKNDVTPSWSDESPAIQPSEPFELVREEQEQASPSIVAPDSIALDPSTYAPLTVDAGKAEELAANPLDWLASAPPIPSGSDEIAVAPTFDETASGNSGPNETVEPAELPAFTLELESQTESQPADSAVNQNVVKQAADAPEDTVRSLPKQDWHEQGAPEHESPQVAWTEMIPVVQSSAEPPAQAVTPAPEPLPFPTPVSAFVPSSAGVSQDAIAGSSASEPDPALVEAVVQRVLDKMRPQVVDIITREFLRPVVQALVQREIEKH